GPEGPEGPQGPQGVPGEPGVGLDPDYCHICALSWKHGDLGTPRSIFERPLVIAFDSPVVNGDLNRMSVSIELMHMDEGFRCWCEPAELKHLGGAKLSPPCEPDGELDLTNDPAAEVNALVIQFASPGQVIESGGWVRIEVNGDLIRGRHH